MAAAALGSGWVVQMRTGEGKTFAAIPAALLHAATSGGVHVATANSYLAERDAGWSGAVLAAAAAAGIPLLPPPGDDGPSAGDAGDAGEDSVLGEWRGWSFNRIVRDRFGPVRDEPPIVLVVDAIGEHPAAGGLTLDLDLDDPSRTV